MPLPAILSAVSIQGIFQHHSSGEFWYNTTSFVLWTVSLFIGSLIGWLISYKAQTKADRKKGLIKTNKNWLPLIKIALIFGIKYSFGHIFYHEPSLKYDLFCYLFHIISAGLISGTSVGKLVVCIYKYKTALHTDLKI